MQNLFTGGKALEIRPFLGAVVTRFFREQFSGRPVEFGYNAPSIGDDHRRVYRVNSGIGLLLFQEYPPEVGLLKIAQTSRHHIELGGQLSDLVAGLYVNVLIVITFGYALRLF